MTPEPTCAEPLRLYGVYVLCDRSRGHLPPDQHASTVYWKAPTVRAAFVGPASRPARSDLARPPGVARRDEVGLTEAPRHGPHPPRRADPSPARRAPDTAGPPSG